jgi:endonuclease-3 related protein
MPDDSFDKTQIDVRLSDALPGIYLLLFARYGPQHWWPGETSFEVMVGAILTQSCSWRNVEKAITALKSAGLLSPEALRNAPTAEIAALIHSCGYYNVKAKKLRALVEWLGAYCRDDIEALSTIDILTLRSELLNIYGIGEETADSILLYACGKPVFVIDAYTRRILARMGIANRCKSYADFQALFSENLPRDAPMFNEYHALFVRLGKETCKKTPVCEGCCLREMCHNSK